MFGDLNGDCDVNILDVVLVALGWDTELGDPAYNPAYDVNNDDKINILDVVQVAERWGDVCGQIAAASAGLSPEQMAHISLDPASGQWLLEGGVYEVAVRVSDVEALGGYQATLSFDPNLLEVVEAVQTDWLESTGRTLFPLPSKIDNIAGTVGFGAAAIGPQQPGVDGNGALAIVSFQPLAVGVSALDFSDTILPNVLGAAIPITWTSGSVEITSGGEPTGTPTPSPSPTRTLTPSPTHTPNRFSGISRGADYFHTISRRWHNQPLGVGASSTEIRDRHAKSQRAAKPNS